MNRDTRVFVAGHRGVVGSAIARRLEADGYSHVVYRTRAELDLRDATAVAGLFADAKPEVVIMAGAKVGGIAANVAQPVEFLVENLEIQNSVLLNALRHEVGTTMFLGSSCIYPRAAPQPMREDAFMTGPLEPTNESYAVAKIAGIRLAQALHEQHGMKIVLPMPCNVYGPGDHFDFDRSHVVSALVRRFAEATDADADELTLWGTGSARREFMHVDDLADACLFLLEHWDSPEIVNVGSGVDHTIAELAELVREVTGFQGELRWDPSKPDGMPKKLMDVSRIEALGWRHTIGIEDGIVGVVEDFRRRQPTLAGTSAQ